MDITNLLLLGVVAGYGDLREDGVPRPEDRAVVLWTNAARVAPLSFTGDYEAGGCSTDDFSEDEKQPQAPLYLDRALTDAAIFHSEDMRDNDCFQHESCDGTDTFERIAEYYHDSSSVGENIASGYPDGRVATLQGWMCSHEGHRANIMAGGYNEIGAGVADTLYTQDFGTGNLDEGAPPVRMAIEHDGTLAFDGGTEISHGWYADWGDDSAPASFSVVMDAIETPMEVLVGTPENGLYVVDSPAAGAATCHQWYVYWKTAAGEEGHFPETGSFLAGDCPDAEIDWIPSQLKRNGLFGDVPPDELEDAMLADLSLVGCQQASTNLGFAAALSGLLLSLRRRDRPRRPLRD